MTEHIDSFLLAWTRAECAGDIEKLERLLADDFCGVGPLGFILPRPAWLARHRELAYQAFDLEEIQTREHGGTAIVIARNNTRGTYRGHPVPEAVRATLVLAGDFGKLAARYHPHELHRRNARSTAHPRGGQSSGGASRRAGRVMTAAITHRRVRVNGIDVHLAEAGDGPPVVLLHGFPELWCSWRHQLPAVARAWLPRHRS